LNQGCVLVHDLESMLLRDPPQNRFSTVSAQSGHELVEITQRSGRKKLGAQLFGQQEH
jgi:hypothetical protein